MSQVHTPTLMPKETTFPPLGNNINGKTGIPHQQYPQTIIHHLLVKGSTDLSPHFPPVSPVCPQAFVLKHLAQYTPHPSPSTTR